MFWMGVMGGGVCDGWGCVGHVDRWVRVRVKNVGRFD